MIQCVTKHTRTSKRAQVDMLNSFELNVLNSLEIIVRLLMILVNNFLWTELISVHGKVFDATKSQRAHYLVLYL